MNSTEEFIYKGYIEGGQNKPSVHLLGKKSKHKFYYLMNLDAEPEIGDAVLMRAVHA